MDQYLEIKKAFEKSRDEENAVKMAKYMRNQFKFYGVAASERKMIYKALLKQEKANKTIDWKFLDKCYQDDYRELQYLVYDYLLEMKNYVRYDDIPKIKNYIKLKQWWDTIDFFDKVIGNIGLTDARVDALMLKWSKDEDFWVRRVAIDHQLGRKGKTNTELLEAILINNFGSDEFFINKAIGWSLRDYSRTNPEWVRNFVNQHRDRMNQLSVKEASKYI